jgi:hypothetical protein
VLAYWYARDKIDRDLKRRFGREAVKPAILMYNARVAGRALLCDYMTCDRNVREQDMRITLVGENREKRELAIHFDMNARPASYVNGRFPIVKT